MVDAINSPHKLFVASKFGRRGNIVECQYHTVSSNSQSEYIAIYLSAFILLDASRVLGFVEPKITKLSSYTSKHCEASLAACTPASTLSGRTIRDEGSEYTNPALREAGG